MSDYQHGIRIKNNRADVTFLKEVADIHWSLLNNTLAWLALAPPQTIWKGDLVALSEAKTWFRIRRVQIASKIFQRSG